MTRSSFESAQAHSRQGHSPRPVIARNLQRTRSDSDLDEVISWIENSHTHIAKRVQRATSEIEIDPEFDALVASIMRPNPPPAFAPLPFVKSPKLKAAVGIASERDGKPGLAQPEEQVHKPFGVHPSFVPITSELPRSNIERSSAREGLFRGVLPRLGKDLLLACNAVLVLAISLVAGVLLIPRLDISNQAIVLAGSGAFLLVAIQPMVSRISSRLMSALFAAGFAVLLLASTWTLRLVVLAGREAPLDIDVWAVASEFSRFFEILLFNPFHGLALVFEAVLLALVVALVSLRRKTTSS